MSPKCLQNVSKMSPKCLQNVSKMSPKCLQNVSIETFAPYRLHQSLNPNVLPDLVLIDIYSINVKPTIRLRFLTRRCSSYNFRVCAGYTMIKKCFNICHNILFSFFNCEQLWWIKIWKKIDEFFYGIFLSSTNPEIIWLYNLTKYLWFLILF